MQSSPVMPAMKFADCAPRISAEKETDPGFFELSQASTPLMEDRPPPLILVGEAGGDEPFEERVGGVRFGLELRVILAGDEPRVG